MTWSPGHGSAQAWSASSTPDTEAVAAACRALRDEPDREKATGGGTLTVRWTGGSGRRTRLTTSAARVADLVRSAVPAPAWAEAEGAYGRWQQEQRR